MRTTEALTHALKLLDAHRDSLRGRLTINGHLTDNMRARIEQDDLAITTLSDLREMLADQEARS